MSVLHLSTTNWGIKCHMLFFVDYVCVCVLCRVGIELPTVEVRFEDLSINAKCRVGRSALPTLWNTIYNFVEVN